MKNTAAHSPFASIPKECCIKDTQRRPAIHPECASETLCFSLIFQHLTKLAQRSSVVVGGPVDNSRARMRCFSRCTRQRGDRVDSRCPFGQQLRVGDWSAATCLRPRHRPTLFSCSRDGAASDADSALTCQCTRLS